MLLEFDVSANQYCKDVIFTISIDGNKFFQTWADIEVKTAQYYLDDSAGQHILELCMQGKTSQHTKLDQHGQIIQDLCFEISKFRVDGIDFGPAFHTNNDCYIHNHNGNGPTIKEKFYGIMGCNGTVKILFSTPIYYWLFGISN